MRYTRYITSLVAVRLQLRRTGWHRCTGVGRQPHVPAPRVLERRTRVTTNLLAVPATPVLLRADVERRELARENAPIHPRPPRGFLELPEAADDDLRLESFVLVGVVDVE